MNHLEGEVRFSKGNSVISRKKGEWGCILRSILKLFFQEKYFFYFNL